METDWTDSTSSKESCAVINIQKMLMNNHDITPSVCSQIKSDNAEVEQRQVMVI